MTLVATPGADNANSYITEDEAISYFETRAHEIFSARSCNKGYMQWVY